MGQLVGAKVESSKLSETIGLYMSQKRRRKVMNGCISVQRWRR